LEEASECAVEPFEGRRLGSSAAAFFLFDYGFGQLDAVGANVYRVGAFDERSDVLVALTAKRAFGI
jgi:hypothetical protein